MKSQTAVKALPAELRFHFFGDDGLHHPIVFAFVSERMYRDILAERDTVLAALAPAQRARQEQLFARYDPQARARDFETLLRRFGEPAHA